MIQYGSGQAVALAEPAWQDDPQEVPGEHPRSGLRPPGQAQADGPAARPEDQARPAGLAGRGPRPRAAADHEPAEGPKAVNAMVIATAATATLFSFAAATGRGDRALGFKFFVFRQTGTGETGDHNLTSSSWPSRPRRQRPRRAHTPGRHSAKTTSASDPT